MRIFGTVLPFIGFKQYTIPVHIFTANEDLMRYDLGDSLYESVADLITKMDSTHVAMKVFEAEWFGFVVGKIYKVGVFSS